MRLFIGVRPSEPVLQQLELMCNGLPKARWVTPENMHVTLQFLGEVGNADAELLDAELATIRMQPFSIALSGLGTFQRGRKPGVLWAGVETSSTLVDLRTRCAAAVRRAGLTADERKFKPHLTLARLRDPIPDRIGAYMASREPFSTPHFEIDRFILFRSHLGKGQAHYEEVADYLLEG